MQRGRSRGTSSFRQGWRYARAYHGQLVAYLLILAASSVLGAAPPLIIRQIVNKGIIGHDTGVILPLVLLTAVAMGGSAVAIYIGVVTSTNIGGRIIADMRTDIFRKLQRMPLGFFSRTPLGAIMSRLDNDVAQLQQFITQTTGIIVRNGITVVVSVTAIVFLNWQVGSLLIICFPVFYIPAKLLERKAESFTLRLMQKVTKLTAFTGDHLSMGAVFLVKGFGRYTSEAGEFRKYSDDVRRTNVQLVSVSALFSLFIAIMGFAAYMSVYGIGGSEAARGAVSVGSVVALGAYAQSLYSPVLALSGVSGGIAGAKVAFSRVFEVLDADLPAVPGELDAGLPAVPGEEASAAAGAPPAPPAPLPGESTPAGQAEHVELMDVSFRFPDMAAVTLPSLMADLPAAEGESHRWILRDVSLDLRPGQVTAMVGPSGEGKSTLCGVIAGLYPPTTGRVLIGGQEISPAGAGLADRRVGYVAQDAFLFNASIRANLSYGRPEAGMDAIREACQIAQIDELIESLSSGYDTVVGERGHRFSGGEKQRLALARMLVADPEILILDEATSAIDLETESRILQRIADGFRNKVLIVVSHRDSVLEIANRIIRIDNARVIVEDWPVPIHGRS